MTKGNWTLQNAEHFVRLKISTVKAVKCSKICVALCHSTQCCVQGLGTERGSRWYQSCCFGAVHYSSSFLGEIQDTSFAKKSYMRNVFFTLFALRFFSFFVLSGDQRCNRTHKWRPCPHIQCLQSDLGDFSWSELISILAWVKAGVWSSQKIFSQNDNRRNLDKLSWLFCVGLL